MKQFTLFTIILVAIIILPINVMATLGINKQIAYQGVLKTSAGVKVSDGDYDIIFKIYNAPTSGSVLWTGTHTAGNSNPVTITDGVFSTLLGSGTGNAMTLTFNDDTYWLGVKVGSDSEMTPRKRIGASGYTFNADTVDGIDSSAFLLLSTWFTTTSDALAQGSTNLYSQWLTNGSDIGYLSGNVGIGTATPATELDVSGSSEIIRVSASGDSNNARVILGSWSGGGAIELYDASEVITAKIRSYSSGGSQAYFTAGNIGIGTSNPETLLHIENPTLDATAQDVLRLQSNTNTVGGGTGIQFRNRWDSGSYWTTARIYGIEDGGYGGQLVFETNLGDTGADDTTVEAMRIDEYGKVGIGTNSPDGFFHLESSGLDATDVSDSGQYSLIIHGENGTNGDEIGLGFSIFGGAVSLDSDNAPGAVITHEKTGGWSAGKLHFKTKSSTLETGNPITRMTIDENGNVGIGTTIPSAKLEIVKVSSTTSSDAIKIGIDGEYDASIKFYDDDNEASQHYKITYGAGTQDLSFSSDQYDNALYLTQSGSIGMGIKTPYNHLHVKGIGNELIVTEGDDTGDVGYVGFQAPLDFSIGMFDDYSDSIFRIVNFKPEAIEFSTDRSGTETIVMTMLDNGNVGIGDTSPDYALDVYGTICQDTNSDDTCDGTVTSDIRLKKNIVPIENALDKVLQLRGVHFQWDRTIYPATYLGAGRQMGMIAQEVEELFPELIYEDMQGYKMIDYQKLTALNIEAIKEQQTEIDQLKSEIDWLKNELLKLRKIHQSN